MVPQSHWIIQEETSKAEQPGSAPDQGPLPDGHGSVIWRFFMITSPFEVSVGTARRSFPGAETCDVQTFRRTVQVSAQLMPKVLVFVWNLSILGSSR